MTLLMAVLHSRSTITDASNEFINVFGYRSNLVVADELNAFADEFEATVIPAIEAVISDNTSMFRLEVRNVTDGVGYLDRIFVPPYTGNGTGASEPAFTAWGFKYHRAAIGKRSGGKRFGAIPDSAVSDGDATPLYQTVLNTLAGVLGSPLTVGIIETWFPVILERKPPGIYPWTDHGIAGVTYSKVTTQNTRKR